MSTKIEADWILKIMAAMAAADQRLDAREVSLIQQVYERLTGEPVDIGGVVSAVQIYARKDVIEELSDVAGSLPLETKTAILRAAYQATLANNNVSQAERDNLDRIATALQLSDAEFESVMTEATEV
ncbi:MAG: hypothetical protein AAGF48_01260 [Pseudomonadota bacterium]